MRLLKFIIIVFSVCIMMSLTACGGSDESSSAAGSLSLKLTDATTNDYKAVYVTIEEVQVCTDDENEGYENSWYTVAEPERTYNLLELVNGVQEQLGVTDLDAGHYTQMRLIIGTTADGELNILNDTHPHANYIVDGADDYYELKIPSGIQTGIKLVSGFNIYENQTTELILDFDASRSVVKAGNSGKWLLKPTIKVIGTTAATISGTVTSDGGLEGVLVSAQVYNSDDDEVIVQASTITDENGNYVLFVEPYVYNLVAYGEGYNPQCGYIEVEPNSEYAGENFALTPVSMGTLSGLASVDTQAVDPYVSISVRQLIQCEQVITIKIEVISFNIADGEAYSVNLPAGSYELVAETEGYVSQVSAVEIVAGDTATRDIIFE
jgi:uncharacterized lipoprotein YehR (DUF1307 family)